MSSFAYVMIGTVAILTAGGILAGFAPQAPGNTVGGTSQPLFYEDLGMIGGGADDGETPIPTSRTVNMGNIVVEEQSPNATVHAEDRLTLQSDYNSKDVRTVEFQASEPQQLYISFIPTSVSTARYFNISVNGQPVTVPELRTGSRVTVPVGQHVRKGSNVIQFTAKSTGFAFWRSPTYEFDNVQVVLDDMNHARVVRPFRVYDYEVNGFDHGELRFHVTESSHAQQPLGIAVNGQEVATRTPVRRATPYTVTFHGNTTGIRPGENTLSFQTSGNARYPLSSVSLDLFYYAEDQTRTLVRNFDMPQSTYNTLEKDEWTGEMTFNVDRIFLQRPITVALPNKSYTFTPKPGKNTRTFDADAVNPGRNTIQISTSGAYRVTGFNMSMVQQ